jgi:hypothetical protein
MSSKSDGKKAGSADGESAGRAAAATIKVDPAKVATYAVKIGDIGRAIDDVVGLLQDPGVSVVIASEPDCFNAWLSAMTAMRTAVGNFASVEKRTVALAYLFEQVDAETFGTGLPERAWESYIDNEAKKHKGKGITGLLDSIADPLDKELIGPWSVNRVRNITDVLHLPEDYMTLKAAISTTGVNKAIDDALRGETGKAARQRARQALVKMMGKDVVGPANGAKAGNIVNEFIEHGKYDDIDELVARVQARSGATVEGAADLRAGLLAASRRVAGRGGRIVQIALEVPGSAAARAAASIYTVANRGTGGGLGFGVSKVKGARDAAGEAIAKFAAKNIRAEGALGKVVARIGLKASGHMALSIVLLPFDIATIITSDTKLGQWSGAFGALASVSAIAAVVTSETVIGGAVFGGIALVATGASATLAGADYVNSKHQMDLFNAAYKKAYEAAAEKGYTDKVNSDLQADLDAINKKFAVKQAKAAGIYRQPVPAATTSKPIVFSRFAATLTIPAA